MRINTNLSSMIAINTRSKNVALVGNSSEKLATGKRIVKAKDDASGMAISKKMEAQIRGLDVAKRLTEEGIEMIDVYNGALSSVNDICGRIRDLSIQASSETLSQDDIAKIREEINQLSEEMYNISFDTRYNGKMLFNGNGFRIPTGANGEYREIDTVYMLMGVYSFIAQANGGTPPTVNNQTGVISGINTKLDNRDDAQRILNAVDALTTPVINSITRRGAIQNRLIHVSNNIDTSIENLSFAKSRIEDVDMAKELVKLSKHTLLLQSSNAMVSQSKGFSEGIINLLK